MNSGNTRAPRQRDPAGGKSGGKSGGANEYKRNITAPLLVLAIYILLLLTRLIDSELLTRDNEYVAVIVLQLIIFMLPAAVYLKLTGNGVSHLRIYPVGLGQLLLLVCAVAALSSGTLLLGAVGGYGMLNQSYDLYGLFISKNDGSAGNVIYLILAYATLPAVCEEFVFRALLCGEYERRSIAASLIMPALFFAMLHFDLSRFPAYFFAGLLLALTFYATRSLPAVILVHMANNLLSIFGRDVIKTLYDLGGEGLFSFIIASVFLLSAFAFCAEASRLYRSYSVHNLSDSYREMKPSSPGAGAGAAFGGAVPEGSALDMLAAKHPRLAATAGSLFALPALGCYLLYAVVVFLGL